MCVVGVKLTKTCFGFGFGFGDCTYILLLGLREWSDVIYVGLVAFRVIEKGPR